MKTNYKGIVQAMIPLTICMLSMVITGYLIFQMFINDHIAENKTIKHATSEVISQTDSGDTTTIKLKNGDIIRDESLKGEGIGITAYNNKYLLDNQTNRLSFNKHDVITYKINRIKQDDPWFYPLGNRDYPKDGYIYTITKVES